jgi:hypothetical protein
MLRSQNIRLDLGHPKDLLNKDPTLFEDSIKAFA